MCGGEWSHRAGVQNPGGEGYTAGHTRCLCLSLTWHVRAHTLPSPLSSSLTARAHMLPAPSRAHPRVHTLPAPLVWHTHVHIPYLPLLILAHTAFSPSLAQAHAHTLPAPSPPPSGICVCTYITPLLPGVRITPAALGLYVHVLTHTVILWPDTCAQPLSETLASKILTHQHTQGILMYVYQHAQT